MSVGLGPSLRRGVMLLLLFAVWESLSRIGWLDPFYAPPPSRVTVVLFSLFADGGVWTHLAATFIAASCRSWLNCSSP